MKAHHVLYMSLGNVYQKQGKMDEAIGAYQKSLELKPEFAFSLYSLAYVYLRQGRYQDAIPPLQKLMGIEPKHVFGNHALGVAYAQQRETFGKPICEHQAIQLKLGEMGTRVEAARLLVRNAAEMYDRGERCDLEAGMAKYFASEAAFENAHEAMRIHGGYGYSKEFAVERLYRDAPLLCIGEGTNEMQRIIIARELIRRNKI